MAQNPGSAPEFVDKTRVLDIKPLRCLVPIFPSQPSPSPFSPTSVFASPSGPFPPGFFPFYPFAAHEPQKQAEQSPPTPVTVPRHAARFESGTFVAEAVPLTSYGTPLRSPLKNRSSDHQVRSHSSANEYGHSNSFSMDIVAAEDDGNFPSFSRRKRSKNRLNSRIVPVIETDCEIDKLMGEHDARQFDSSRRNDGNEESVKVVLNLFNLLRRKITQLEEAGGLPPGRVDLRSSTVLSNKGIRTNMSKRIGSVPGVEVGDIFFFRIEMCLIGLHSQSMSGIDYMFVRVNQHEEPLAVSIVSSGVYEDANEDPGVLFYSGQGKEESDQKLERGNLALEKSLHRANDVRVIRGFKDEGAIGTKIYVYDGLYRIQDSWVEIGKSGCNVFKYKLVRIPGQPSAFAKWKSIQHWKGLISSRPGLILQDLTSGSEKLHVCLVNNVDVEKGPAYFSYYHTLKHKDTINVQSESYGCDCRGCLPRGLICSCIMKNGKYLPYNMNGVLVEKLSVIRECGSLCRCFSNCRNRVSQGGLKLRLEVFRTKDKGWGLRSWDPIRTGAFICEYAGEQIDISYLDEDGNDFIFDATRTYLAEENSIVINDVQRSPFPLVISANSFGNVSRFINHSCSPNMFWQSVLQGDFLESNLHIAFYASKHIPPLTELTFDYGVIDTNKGEKRKTECLCGSPKCRGFFYR